MSDTAASRTPVNALLAALEEVAVRRFADLSGGALDLAIALQRRQDCMIALVGLLPDGGFGAAPDWIGPYREALIAAEVEPSRIEVVCEDRALKPFDVIANVDGFGARYRIRHLAPVMSGGIHADSVMLADIRRGSGGFPWLKERGSSETIARFQDGRGEVSRVLFRPKPPEVASADDIWAGIARGLAGPDGFFRDGAGHSLLYVPRSPEVLVVTFDNLDIAMTKREERRPWGYDFIEKQGWSMLGVMANGWTWYRDPWVFAEFDRLRDDGFFARFGSVVFYGASMGGYAACAFSPACPGADVVAISPQSTLDRALVPWERRYRSAWGYDYSGPYGDAAAVSSAARQVTIFYDPYAKADAAHVARFGGTNVAKLRAPLMGHRLGTALQQMGVLSPVILEALAGTLTPASFYRRLRLRHRFPRYQWELFQRAIARGRPGLARKTGRWVLAQGSHPAIRRAMKEL